MSFKDHFSGASGAYDRYRPHYPQALFQYLFSQPPSRQRAWDCATGTGQVAQALITGFDEVIATDASITQITAARPVTGIHYRVAPAEASGLEAKSVDLITVAQALHWFDIVRFFTEADRVLRPNGVLAIWSYNLLNIRQDLDAIITQFYNMLEEFWPKERGLIETGYASIGFPYKKIEAPALSMQAQWNLDQLIGYLGTWSAVRHYQRAMDINPLTRLHEELLSRWENPDETLWINWPLSTHFRKK